MRGDAWRKPTRPDGHTSRIPSFARNAGNETQARLREIVNRPGAAVASISVRLIRGTTRLNSARGEG
jgi:hypothetical protein